MRIIPCEPECFTVFEAGALDPVLVILQDFGGGQGRVTLECYGRAWSCYWGAMGDGNDLRKFMAACSDDYIANRMLHGAPITNKHARKRELEYLLRVVAAAKLGMAERSPSQRGQQE